MERELPHREPKRRRSGRKRLSTETYLQSLGNFDTKFRKTDSGIEL